MRTETRSLANIPSQDEARAITERARRLRADVLAGMLRTAWWRIARRPTGAMPHARA